MTASIEVETEDFARAARSLYSDVGDPLTTAVVRTIARLQECGTMAGSDPAGTEWAGSYDRAVAATLRASQDAINACYQLSAMFAQTARNYEAAEQASTAGARHAVAALPDPCVIGLATEVPGAAGGSGAAPPGWGLISHAVGYLWPNGHQDRLRAAAHAWRRSGDALWLHSEYVAVAAIPARADRVPEAPDMDTVCNSLYLHIRDVAHAHYGLADACDQLAHHIDEVHSAVEHELISLAEWTAGIELTGGLLSIVTLGAAEAPTQAVEAARIAKTAARVGELIQRFSALTRTTAASIATVVERADRAAAGMVGLLDVRLTTAVVETVRTLPGAVKVRELTALNRLSATARGLAPLSVPVTQVRDKYKHASAFGVALAKNRAGIAKFEQALNDFVTAPTTVRVGAARGRYYSEPAILNYDLRSRLVVVQRPDGAFWTCWRMSERQLMFVRRYGTLGRG